MGVRLLIANINGHKDHHWILHARRLSEPMDKPDRLTCWCGEEVEQVK